MNKSIIKFNWSKETNTKLNKVGIRNIEDFKGVSLKALKEMGISEKTVKQIEDICKVHNIKTKDSEIALYHITFTYTEKVNNKLETYEKTRIYLATNPEEIKSFIRYECELNDYTFVGLVVNEIISIHNTPIFMSEIKSK